MVLGFFGRDVPLEELRAALGTGRDGTTLTNLLQVANQYGLRGRAVRVEIEGLRELSPGTILFWEFRHYVVLQRARLKSIDVVDPAGGRRRVSLLQLRRSFTGVALLLEPTDAFERRDAKPKHLGTLLSEILTQRSLLVRIASTSILIEILSMTLPLLTGVVIDRVVPRKDYSLLLVLAVSFALIQTFTTFASFLKAHLFIHLQTQLQARFTLRFLDHLVDLPFSFFQQRTSGDIMVRVGNNNTVKDILTGTALSAVLDGLMASVYLILLLLVSLQMTILVVAFACARLLIMAWMRYRQKELLANGIEISGQSSTAMVEMLSGMETLKAMGLERRAAENWSNIFVDGLNLSIRQQRLSAAFGVLMGVLGTGSTLATTFYGSYLVLTGTFTLGTMIAFTALSNGFLSPVNKLVTAALQLQTLEVYLERINEVFATPSEQSVKSEIVGKLQGCVAMERVSFRYTSTGVVRLDDVSLKVTSGMRVALVGPTGSGKSTLARLIAGLYEPTAGRILYDGRDLQSLDRRSVRSQLGIVTQETQLFGGSIRRNIALSNPSMALEQVVKAAKLACIHDEIALMPMGYETILADRGMSLSGGQRQRLALARALASNPAILVLDEATSSLDSITEERISKNITEMGCTRIVIAHRLNTIRDADFILVLDGGRIVESGNHDELVRASGIYASLFAA